MSQSGVRRCSRNYLYFFFITNRGPCALTQLQQLSYTKKSNIYLKKLAKDVLPKVFRSFDNSFADKFLALKTIEFTALSKSSLSTLAH